MEAGVDPKKFVLTHVKNHPKLTIVCDEVGGGVVPIDKNDREYREVVGRICCELAALSSRVERIYCGIPTVLKSEEQA